MWEEFVKIVKDNPAQISAVVALCALMISFMSIVLTFTSLRLQRQHNFKSVVPIANILLGDYEDNLQVTLKNTGIGPLVIEKFRVFHEGEEKDDIISWMPSGILWNTFTQNINGRCIPAGESLTLLKLTENPQDFQFAANRDATRRALSKLTAEIQYKDVYDRQMPVNTQSFIWFSRNLASK